MDGRYQPRKGPAQNPAYRSTRPPPTWSSRLGPRRAAST